MEKQRKNNFSLGDLDDCPVETAIKNGYQRKRSYPETGLPKLPEGLKKGVPSPLIAAFNLDENGE